MTQTELIYNSIKSKEFFDGAKSMLEFLRSEGVGMETAMRIISEIEKAREQQ